MDVLALIPARGGSKGLPRKNVLPLAGKPVIAYTIEVALASGRVTRTVVSTDDAEIAEKALAHGAEVPFLRPAELAQDTSPDIDVFRHALEWLRENDGYEPELVVHLRPTNPLRRVADVDKAIDLIAAHPEADALRSVSWPVQTPYKMWRLQDGYLVPLLELEGVTDSHSLPRQALPEVWWQNGYVDVVRPRTVLELGSMTGRCVLPLVVEDPGIELDYEDQLASIEAVLEGKERARNEGPGRARHPV